MREHSHVPGAKWQFLDDRRPPAAWFVCHHGTVLLETLTFHRAATRNIDSITEDGDLWRNPVARRCQLRPFLAYEIKNITWTSMIKAIAETTNQIQFRANSSNAKRTACAW